MTRVIQRNLFSALRTALWNQIKGVDSARLIPGHTEVQLDFAGMQSFLTSLEASGFVIVPKEASEPMRESFFQAHDEYSQLKNDRVFPRPTLADYCFNMMIDARPKLDDE